MITPMLHTTIICRKQDTETLLLSLRDFAGMHLQLVPTDHQKIDERAGRHKQVEQLIQKLERIEEPRGTPSISDPEAHISRCLTLFNDIKRIRELDQLLIKEEQLWAPFGNIEPQTVSALRSGNLDIAFYRAAVSPVDLPKGTAWLTADPGYGVAISVDSLAAVETQALRMPARGPARIAPQVTIAPGCAQR